MSDADTTDCPCGYCAMDRERERREAERLERVLLEGAREVDADVAARIAADQAARGEVVCAVNAVPDAQPYRPSVTS